MSLSEYSQDPQTALIVVDMQADFYPGGALPVAGGDEIVEPIAHWMSKFQTVVVTQDTHPEGHISFASSYKDKKPFDLLTLEALKAGDLKSPLFTDEEIASYLESVSQNTQVLWPDHCVRGSSGWALDPKLPLDRADVIIRKGTDPRVDSYSAFFENDGRSTGLGGMLRDRNIKRVVTVGLAGDYCVYWTAKDALREGFGVIYDESLTRFVSFPEGSKATALDDLQTRGVRVSGT